MYSPKLGRRLQCFGEEQYDQWIRLEADPMVTAFCERPVNIELLQGCQRPADFWARKADSETLLIIGEECKLSTITMADAKLSMCTVPSAELAAARIWIDNWKRMLPCLTACHKLIPTSLINSVLKLVSEAMPFSRIEREFSTGDPTLIRAAIFSLVYSGKLKAPQLEVEPLSYRTCFQPGRFSE